MTETFPAIAEANSETETPLITPTGLVPFVRLSPEELEQAAGPAAELDATNTLPTVPTETMALPTESLPDRRLQLGSEIGAVSLGNLVPRPVRAAAVAVKGLWKTLTASHGEAALTYEQKAEDSALTAAVMRESSKAALGQRGNRTIVPGYRKVESKAEDGSTVVTYVKRHPGSEVDLAPVTFAERRQFNASWHTKNAVVSKNQKRSNSLAATFGRVGEDGYNDMGTEAYFERVNAARMEPRLKQAAIKAGNDYNRWQGKKKAGLQKLTAGGNGEDKAGQAQAAKQAEYERRAAAERAAANRRRR